MIVTVFGERLDLYVPAQADRFLVHVRSYREAESLEWSKQFLLAQRVVSAAIYDASHAGDDEQSDEDRFEAYADGMTELDQGDH